MVSLTQGFISVYARDWVASLLAAPRPLYTRLSTNGNMHSKYTHSLFIFTNYSRKIHCLVRGNNDFYFTVSIVSYK